MHVRTPAGRLRTRFSHRRLAQKGWAVIAFLAFSIIYTCAALYSETTALIRGAARLVRIHVRKADANVTLTKQPLTVRVQLTMQTTINLALTFLAYEVCAVLGVFQGIPPGDNSVADRHRAGAQCLFAGCIFISFFTLTLMLTLDLACDGDKSLATVSPLMSQIHASQFIEMAPPNVTRGSPPLVMHSGIRTCDMCGCSVRCVDRTQNSRPQCCSTHDSR